MNDYKDAKSDTDTNQNQALFICDRVVRIGKQKSIVIQEDGFGFIKADTVLFDVRPL